MSISDLTIEKAENLPLDHPIIAELSIDTNGVHTAPASFEWTTRFRAFETLSVGIISNSALALEAGFDANTCL